MNSNKIKNGDRVKCYVAGFPVLGVILEVVTNGVRVRWDDGQDSIANSGCLRKVR